jgi:hypothetical protein
MKQLKEQEITFEPMEKKQCEFFYASYILPCENQLPGIPMHHAALYKAEAESRFKCESLALKFENSDSKKKTPLPSPQDVIFWALMAIIPDAYAFYRLYKNEKARWLEGIKGKVAPNPSRMPQN